VVEINTEDTALSDMAHHSLRGKAGEILPALVGLVMGGDQSREEGV
jgi:NAD-dependent SIR2 family protein deacetylase